jgi:hypothetical protein
MSESRWQRPPLRIRWETSPNTSPGEHIQVRLLRVFLVARFRFRRPRSLPPIVVFVHEIGRGSGVGQIALSLAGVRFGRGSFGPGLLQGAGLFGAIDLACQVPRRAAREVRRGELAARQSLLLLGCGRRERALEIELSPLRSLGVVARCFDVPQRCRESVHLAVDVLFADSPERVERIFSRHDD